MEGRLPILRLVSKGKGSLTDIETNWGMCDVLDMLDLVAAEEEAELELERKRNRKK